MAGPPVMDDCSNAELTGWKGAPMAVVDVPEIITGSGPCPCLNLCPPELVSDNGDILVALPPPPLCP
eukprot:CAMPEP_0113563566 /NCGR_PEP_ID=MMETSP0015_2-20120614/21139_1 /TAXON_ID=2838 /ORGANISM="Odontella" /LENGTH=66 /DNA_ID=CAMNT_0000465559 /DNA_START=898 /DNA_END=1094 /DNA_ORIENTATION=+ /assembly_acc=CAM_ASM_000160